jgi:23S rRNA pseudouridine2605 synthase
LSTNPTIPSADQLAASRLNRWHQTGEALLTFENVRSWLNAAGIVLFTPRNAQLPAPAPSMVEAVLGAPNDAPSVAETEAARSLLARLIIEGAAVSLNLLGAPGGAAGDTPDFVVSAAVFPYIFTLRGDKSWKQAPSTSGATKVSPLALAAYILLEKENLSAYDLTTQLGKEVTESAVLRALNELWSHLRVLPIYQQDGGATLWEVTATRYTKQMKAGANAGLPTALSALVTLYLGQSIVATEDEIETFVSPLIARSKVRDVVHALMAARQLETVAVEGKTMLHVTGDLPAFLSTEVVVDPELPGAIAIEGEEAVEGDAPRIKKFVAKPRKLGTGYVAKLDRVSRPRPDFITGSDRSASTRERRPFTRESNRPDRPSFTKPWAEEKADRLAAVKGPDDAPNAASEQSQDAPRSFERKPSFDRGGSDRGGKRFGSKPSFGAKPSFGSRPSFGNKPSFGGKPSFGSKPGFSRDRGGFAGKPSFSRDRDGESRPPRREFTPRPSGDAAGGPEGFGQDRSAPRKTFSKPGTFGRKREGGFAGKPGFGEGRPPRRDFGGDRPSFGGDRPKFGGNRPAFGDRPSFGGGRKPFAPREGGFAGKPSFSRDRESGGEGGGERPFKPQFRKFDAPRGPRTFSGDRSDRGDRPARPAFGGKPGFGSKPSGGFAGRSEGGYKPRSEGGYQGKSDGGFAGKKPYGKPAGGSFGGKKPFGKPGGFAGKSSGGFAAKTGKPAGTFDKFKGNKKPFGNRPPARKYKPQEGE